jgi:hypothetical protein
VLRGNEHPMYALRHGIQQNREDGGPVVNEEKANERAKIMMKVQ